jgi:hypothetical protein
MDTKDIDDRFEYIEKMLADNQDRFDLLFEMFADKIIKHLEGGKKGGTKQREIEE